MNSAIIVHLSSHSRELESVATRSVLGVPLFLRAMLACSDAGYREFIVIAHPRLRRTILKGWQRIMGGRGCQIQLVLSDGATLTATQFAGIRQHVAARVCLLDACTVVTNTWVTDVLAPGLRQTHLPQNTAPAVLCDTQSLEAALAQYMAQDSTRPPITQARRYCRITHPAQIATLEHFLCEHIRLGANGWVARTLNKRVSLPISRGLARLRVPPNAITAFNMLVGLCAGIGTGGMTYVGLLWGGILLQLASILDGCDGEVAKLTHRTSKFGQLIDTLSDNFALASFFIGLTIHEYRVSHNPLAFLWGAALLAGIGALLWQMFRYLRTHTDSLSLVTFDKMFLQRAEQRPTLAAAMARYGKAVTKKEWFSLLFLGLAIAGILPLALYATIAVSWIGALTVWQLLRAPRLAAARMPAHGREGVAHVAS